MSVRILTGDCRDVLKTLPDESVHCVVTSPPYWGLRDYGTATWEGGDVGCDHSPERRGGRFSGPVSAKQASNVGSGTAARRDCSCGAIRVDSQLGLEATPQEYVERMVEVFREVRRVLRDDGTLWLNLGDSYAGYWGDRKARDEGRPSQADTNGWTNGFNMNARPDFHTAFDAARIKPKDLVGIPWRLAFALQADGWWLRQDIIWAKPNPMPESVTDRCTKAHEYIFLLAKSERYYYDQDAILEPVSPGTHARLSQDVQNQIGSERVPGKTNGNMKAVGRASWRGSTFDGPRDLAVRPTTGRKRAESGSGIKNNDSMDAALAIMPESRNKRSVWTVTTQPFKEAHFATFPPALIEPCILAGTSAHGCCSECGAPFERQVNARSLNRNELPRDHPDYRPRRYDDGKAGDPQSPGPGQRFRQSETTGWEPTCECLVAPEPCTVLDPFGGAGTTGLVADRLGRNAILIELNPSYAEMARKRISDDAPLFAEVE